MKKLLLIVLVFVGIFTLFSFTALPALADPKEDACAGVELTGGSCDGPAAGEPTVDSVIETVINILSIIVGVIAVIMIIIGGLKYITSTGDSNSVNGAKNTILYAVIGLIVVAVAQIIVRFVINQVT